MGIWTSKRKAPRRLPQDACFSDGRGVWSLLCHHLGRSPDEVARLNHRGLLSLKVRSGTATLKIAECESAERAALAEQALIIVNRSGGPVPGFLWRDKAVIACRWIEGKPCHKENTAVQIQQVMNCQERLFTTVLPPEINPPARYVHLESLLNRFGAVAPGVISRRRTQAIVTSLPKRLPSEPGKPRIIHPDLTPVNIIIAENGPVVVDNEAIAIGAGSEFDVWNSGEAVFGHRHRRAIERYARQFHERCPLPTLFSYRFVWDDFRRLRLAMRAIEKRRYLKAWRLIFQINSDQGTTPGSSAGNN